MGCKNCKSKGVLASKKRKNRGEDTRTFENGKMIVTPPPRQSQVFTIEQLEKQKQVIANRQQNQSDVIQNRIDKLTERINNTEDEALKSRLEKQIGQFQKRKDNLPNNDSAQEKQLKQIQEWIDKAKASLN